MIYFSALSTSFNLILDRKKLYKKVNKCFIFAKNAIQEGMYDYKT